MARSKATGPQLPADEQERQRLDLQKHAPISPSGIYRSNNCLASLMPAPQIPDRVSAYAQEGDEFHKWVARATEEGSAILAECPDEEMREHARHLIYLRNRVKNKIGPKAIYKELIEARVYFSDNIFGTIDYGLLYVRDGQKRIYAEDAKYGRGVAVPVRYPIGGGSATMDEVGLVNPQIATYIAAIRKDHGWPAVQATAAIYQPRNCDHSEKPLDQTIVTAKELAAWDKQLTKLEPKALKVLRGETKPEAHYGPWCQFCKRIPICPTYAKEASAEGVLMIQSLAPLPQVDLAPAIVRRNGSPDKPVVSRRTKRVDELTDEEINRILSNADTLRTFLKEVEAYACARSLTGREIPGWKVVAGRVYRKWIENHERVADSLRIFGITEPWRKQLITITEAQKHTTKENINQLTEYPEPRPKLVRDADPRPALRDESLALLTDLTNEGDDNAEEQ